MENMREKKVSIAIYILGIICFDAFSSVVIYFVQAEVDWLVSCLSEARIGACEPPPPPAGLIAEGLIFTPDPETPE